MSSTTQTFHADAVLFDMDGTLTDSIAAVEAAWGKVAKDIGQDPDYVIAATHGKRAVDNLSQFKPQLLLHEIEEEVERFENTILYYADAYHMHRDGSQSPDASGSSYSALSSPGKDMENHHPMYPIPESYAGSSDTTPDLTPGPTAPPSRRSSITHRSMSMTSGRRPSFGSRLLNMLGIAAHLRIQEAQTELEEVVEDCLIQQMDVDHSKAEEEKARRDIKDAWQVEAASTDRSVRILPGVRKMIDSLPEGRYAVATSGAKTYAYGCMKRVGIVPPPVTITADDKRLKAGKPAPDPFLLAAECLGYDAKRCVVFEDSPSGIRAGVASGATVIAVCTSHEREKIEGCGAHYIVENMEKVHCDVAQDGQLKFTVEA